MSTFPWAYANQTAPLPERQLHPYGHGSIHTDDGAFWITDLGSDTVWKYDPPEVGTNNFSLGVEYKVPEGFGPRHLATPDGKNVYAIGEMSNQVIALSEGNTATDPVSILPAGLSEEYGQYMGGGEIQAHPTVPTTLYASNRNQRLITEKVPDYVAPEGDTVTILQVTEAGKAPEVIAQIETKCDHIRGMKISPDGKYVAVGGMNNNKMEVYAISGDNMEEWTLVATQEVLQIADITFFPK